MARSPRKKGPQPRKGGGMMKPAALQRHDEDDEEYYEINDDRPNLEPIERPSDERGERPMRPVAPSRWGPRRGKSR